MAFMNICGFFHCILRNECLSRPKKIITIGLENLQIVFGPSVLSKLGVAWQNAHSRWFIACHAGQKVFQNNLAPMFIYEYSQDTGYA